MFEKGDVVRLKSGGPSMTISRRSPKLSENIFEVVYFNSEGILSVHELYGECLEKVNNTYNMPPAGGWVQQLTVHEGK